jgi:ribosomal protein S18 acetylase RimI-like enzyme
MNVRSAEEAEIDHLAKVWHEGWHDAHARILPAELTRLRTLESFRDRLQAALPKISVVGPFAAPVGFCILKGNELYQLYVSAQARGSGVAAALLADAEARLAEAGFESAWLACAIGNERAARFYDKCGWRRTGTMVSQATTRRAHHSFGELAGSAVTIRCGRYYADCVWEKNASAFFRSSSGVRSSIC